MFRQHHPVREGTARAGPVGDLTRRETVKEQPVAAANLTSEVEENPRRPSNLRCCGENLPNHLVTSFQKHWICSTKVLWRSPNPNFSMCGMKLYDNPLVCFGSRGWFVCLPARCGMMWRLSFLHQLKRSIGSSLRWLKGKTDWKPWLRLSPSDGCFLK